MYPSFIHPVEPFYLLFVEEHFFSRFQVRNVCISLLATTFLVPLVAADALGAFSELLRAMAVFVCRQLGHVMLMLVMTRFH